MARTATTIPVTGVELDPGAAIPLSRQLYDRLRGAILSGQMGSGFRLPATRTLATELGVSRNTVLRAYDQLVAEGYIDGKTRSGTTVTRVLPDALLSAPVSQITSIRPAEPSPSPGSGVAAPGPSRRGAALAAAPTLAIAGALPGAWMKPFQTGVPALDAFPTEIWVRLVTRHLRRAAPDLLAYQDPAGYPPLRAAIAAYIGASRGVRCTADQVIVVAGAQSGLDLAARVLLDPGDAAWIEDPGYLGARNALIAAGARLVPVPVDADGLNVAAGEARAPNARLASVTPAHQHPVGATMSLPRRLALLDWAARAGAWVVEDDYDGEFRYAGRPLAALQGLRPDGTVIYIGTFSKVLFPALRLGYMVVPSDLVRTFVAARLAVDVCAPVLEQVALTDFITEGHFARHVRRMRMLYAKRAAAVVTAARRDLVGLLDVALPTTGMHVAGWLPPGVDDREAARLAAAHDVAVLPISKWAVEPLDRGGLVLGFAAVDEPTIQAGIRRLATALRPLVRG